MTSFLFWNILGKDLRPQVTRAVIDRDVDIILLAECDVTDTDLAATLTKDTGRHYEAVSLPNDKGRVFTRLPSASWIRRQTDSLTARMGVWSVDTGKSPGILLAAAHFLSKNNTSESEHAIMAVELGKEISRVEDFVGHQQTVLVGDLNMNPFEDGVTGVNTLHAVMTKKIAGRISRVYQGRDYRFFYNPMWGCFGDRTSGPPGTYYHRAASPSELFWHILDQVLLRPDLMDNLADLAILDSIGGVSLLTQDAGLPRSVDYSDHLPLAFRLNLN
jgi:hypothetical protein